MYRQSFVFARRQGKASLDIANLRGDTPLKMLQINAGSIWVGQKVMEKIRDETHANQRQSFLVKLTLDKVRFIQFQFSSAPVAGCEMANSNCQQMHLLPFCHPNVACSLVLNGGHTIPHILRSWFNS